MFLEKTDNILMQFARNTQGYFLRKNSEKNENIDNEILSSLKLINKEIKKLVILERKFFYENEMKLSREYKNKARELTNKKDMVLSKLTSKYRIKPVGYHTKEDSSGVHFYPMYVVNGYSYHTKSDIDFVKKHNLEYLGILENQDNYRKQNLYSFDKDFDKAVNLIDDFLK